MWLSPLTLLIRPSPQEGWEIAGAGLWWARALCATEDNIHLLSVITMRCHWGGRDLTDSTHVTTGTVQGRAPDRSWANHSPSLGEGRNPSCPLVLSTQGPCWWQSLAWGGRERTRARAKVSPGESLSVAPGAPETPPCTPHPQALPHGTSLPIQPETFTNEKAVFHPL